MADREKQIEEIAQEIRNGLFKQGKGWVVLRVAEHLYEQGYRKQSEGEWKRKDGFLVCSKCDATKPIAFSTAIKLNYHKCDFCPKCGAKMKGGE